jgi:1,4-alpha-glucan branching enzyme
MRVLFISRRFYPEVIGGGQISALYIAKAVKEQGNEVYVCTFTEKDSEDNIYGVKIFRKKMPQSRLKQISNLDYMYLQMARLCSKVIEEVKPDVIHLLNFESVPLSAIHFKKKFRLPIVATVNGPLFGCFTQNAIDYKGETCTKCRVFKRYLCSASKWGKIKGSAYYVYSHWYMNMLRESYRHVDRFFIVSKAMEPLLVNMGVPKRKITVVHNPVDVKKEVKTDLKKRLKIEGKKVILYAGRLAEEKGVQHIIRALSLLNGTVLVVAGEKRGEYTKLVGLAHQLKVTDKVRFVGFVDNNKLKEYYSITDSVVLPCAIYESLSRMLLEACSYGIPLVASDVGGNSEIVRHGKNGILLKDNEAKTVANAISTVMEKHKKMSVASLKVIKDFSSEKIGRDLVDNYKKLI